MQEHYNAIHQSFFAVNRNRNGISKQQAGE
jgi:hypothetical protein